MKKRKHATEKASSCDSLAVIVVGLAFIANPAFAADTKPNIVFILTDNLGYDETGHPNFN